MKKILYRVSALLAATGLMVSCLNDTLEVESQSSFDSSVVFSNYQLAEYAVIGIGEIFAHTNSYNARLNHMYGYNTDIELKMGSKISGAKEEEYTLAEYDTRIDNGSLNTANNGYNEIMVGVERANLAVDGLRKYADLKDPDMAYLLGEALTYRALLYEELVKMWGDVPLHLEPLSSETLYDPKTDRDEIYRAILADLEEAQEYLYWPFESPQTSRADRMNKAFAKGLYGRVALMAAGWAHRPADGKVGTGDFGSLRLSVNEDLSKAALYPTALQHLRDIITSGTLELERFETLWRKFNDFTHMTSREVMWVQPFSDGRGRWNYAHAYSFSAGSPYITDQSRGGGGATGPNPVLWWHYEKQDVRRDVTCVPIRWANDGFEARDASGFGWGKYRFEWMTTVPFPGGTADGCKPIVMRYADVYLMAAEMAAYLGYETEAKNDLLEVRKRAYEGNENMAAAYVNSLSMGDAAGNELGADYKPTEGTIMKAIMDERALEFAGEFLRKQDLIRWGQLKVKMDEASKELRDLAFMQGAYAYYMPATNEKDVTDDKTKEVLGTYNNLKIYWRPTTKYNYPSVGVLPVEIFGLEKDEVGKAPADADEGGWKTIDFLSDYRFYNKNGGAYGDEAAYRWNYLYYNEFNDPYPRSVWPIFGQNLTNAQGSLVNDYGYDNL